jgi:hypothetical protein
MTNEWIVDRLGTLKAKMSDLAIEYDNLKGLLEDQGPGAYEGVLYRATVSTYDRHTLDMEAVKEHLSYQFLTAHTHTKEVTKVNVVARNARNVIAVVEALAEKNV